MIDYAYWQFDESGMTKVANQVKEIVINALSHEGLLKGDPEEISGTFVIVLHKKGCLGKIWDKLLGIEDQEEGAFYTVLKATASTFRNRGGGGEERKESHLKVVPIHPDDKEKE